MNPAGMFNTTAAVNVPSSVSQQADGSVAVSFTSTTVPCAINPLKPSEAIAYNRPAGMVMAKMYCGPSVSFSSTPTKATVTWGGFTWLVVGAPLNVGGRTIYQEIVLERKL